MKCIAEISCTLLTFTSWWILYQLIWYNPRLGIAKWVLLICCVISLSSDGQYLTLSTDDCMEHKRKDYQNRFVSCCVQQWCRMIRTHMWAVFTVDSWFWLTSYWRLWITSNNLSAVSTSFRFETAVDKPISQHAIAFSALTLLAEHQEEHPACKNWVMRCWCGYRSGARCKWFACGPADATATPSSLHQNPEWFFQLIASAVLATAILSICLFVCPSVCLSIHLSVTRRYCVKLVS